MVTGLDLVAMQIQVALGEKLDLSDVRPVGHAIQCRINAEDPARSDLPGPGRITAYREPSGPFVRVDAAVRQGKEIPPDYDSMFAKLIVSAENRGRAISRMDRALGEYHVEGVPTTIRSTAGSSARGRSRRRRTRRRGSRRRSATPSSPMAGSRRRSRQTRRRPCRPSSCSRSTGGGSPCGSSTTGARRRRGFPRVTARRRARAQRDRRADAGARSSASSSNPVRRSRRATSSASSRR